ncbi:LYR motif containing protein 1-like [Liolophura sinensis]|uniref:LYR motif containing protein 1-like n=1 Tax=Liolophura sinensis TaxID=3198878 RepID=UPI0031585DD4
MALKKEVLSLYRRILRLSRTWEATNPTATTAERDYIASEARVLFRQNKQIDSDEEIQQHIREAEARIEIAKHYQNPYPRLTNIPQQVLPLTGHKVKKGQQRALKQSTPVYLKSLYDTRRK